MEDETNTAPVEAVEQPVADIAGVAEHIGDLIDLTLRPIDQGQQRIL